jgi:uncharacterized protein YjbI with pentapeptide repeats
MVIEIKNRWNGDVIFSHECENNTISMTVKKALNSYANLSGANLSDVDLSGANLSGVDLSGANLSGVDLSGANLSYANLSGAKLSGANLSYANLSRADLSGVDLSGADLSRADLSRANLSAIKNDLWSVLLQQKEEVLGLKNTLKLGNIDGSVYDGDCCCLIGTIGKVANCNYKNLKVQPNPNRPIERWFLAIKKGDNPENSQVAKITLEWIEEFETLIK